MSWEATAWAAKQHAGTASAKLVLLCIANHADANGVCFPSRKRLAVESHQSVDTIDRRLKDLEELGLIRRSDRPKLFGSGDTTKQITLCLNPGRLDSELAGHRDCTDRPPACDEGEPQIAAPPAADCGPPLGTALPPRGPQSCGPIEPSLEPSIEPLSAGAARENADGPREREANDDFEKDFEALWRAWPNAGGVFSKADCWEALRRLTVKDRKLACRMAPVYLAALKTQNRKHVPDPARWLRKRQFADVAEGAQTQAEAMGLKHPPIFVRKGTPAWAAWQERWWQQNPGMRGREAFSFYSEIEKAHGVHKPTLFPPKSGSDPPDTQQASDEVRQQGEGEHDDVAQG